MLTSQSSDKSETTFSDLQKRKALAFWQKRGFLLSCLFTIIWFVFIWDYLSSSAWWEGRYDLSPAELIGHISGLMVPIVVMFLVTAYFDRAAQLDIEAQKLESYLYELVYPSEEGAVYTQALTEALREQIKEFRGVFAQVTQETGTVREELKQWVLDLGQIVKQMNTQTIDSIREVAGYIKNLSDMTNQANEQATNTASLFMNQANVLSQVVTQADEKLKYLSEALSDHTIEIQTLIQTIEGTNNQTDMALGTANNMIKQMVLTSQNMGKAVEIYEENTNKQNERLFGNLERILSAFQKQGALLDNEVQQISNRMGVVSQVLMDHTKSVLDQTSTAMNGLEKMDSQFLETAQKADKILGQIKQDVSNIQEDMDESIKKAVKVFPTTQQQMQKDLLQDATVILDRLQEFSVDMAHVFTPKSEGMLWEKYYAGDKAVFMRHITKMLNTTQHKKILNLYETNEDFRLAVTRYMAEFEGMTKKAQEGEESKLLMSVLIGSDVGRLYMVLADVLKGDI